MDTYLTVKNTRPKKTKVKKRFIPFAIMVPNIVTLIGLIVGASSIRFALEERWEAALYSILIAAVIDGIDGRIARMLGAATPFGKELDSLCDFANFGIAPAMVMNLWMQGGGTLTLSWVAILLYIVCMAVRLARFNTGYDNKLGSKKGYLTGIAAPPGAICMIMPMMIDMEIAQYVELDMLENIIVIDLYIIVISCLIISTLPTLSVNNLIIKTENLNITIVISFIAIMLTILYPWYVLPLAFSVYLLSIPLCLYHSKKNITEIDEGEECGP